MKKILEKQKVAFNPFLSPTRQAEIKYWIISLGGVIAETIDHETIYITETDYYPSGTLPAKVATPQWLSAMYKHQKIHLIDKYSPNPRMICSGFIVYGYGLEECDLAALYGGVDALGGQWRNNYSQDVTHVVTHACENVSRHCSC